MHIAWVGNITGRYSEAIIAALGARGHRVSVLKSFGAVTEADPHFDVGVLRLASTDLGASLGTYAALEAGGVPTFNSSRAHLLSESKVATHRVFANAGLSQPQTWLVHRHRILAPELQNTEMVLKPDRGWRGEDVALVAAGALPHEVGVRHGLWVAQEYMQDALCWRVIATPTQVLRAYVKDPEPGHLVASVEFGAKREYHDLPSDIRALAHVMVIVLGADLAGVDILQTPGQRPLALEANLSFNWDLADERLPSEIAELIESAAKQNESQSLISLRRRNCRYSRDTCHG